MDEKQEEGGRIKFWPGIWSGFLTSWSNDVHTLFPIDETGSRLEGRIQPSSDATEIFRTEGISDSVG